MKSNVLVTGAGGQLGSELRLLAGGGERHSCRYWFTDVGELDITDSRAVNDFMEGNRIDTVINCAAYTAVDRAEENEAEAQRINSDAVAILSRACQRTDATMIHVSTDYVFDGHSQRPYREDDPVNPTGAYGRTKLSGEIEVAASGCRALVIRTAWLYSPFGNNFVKTMLRLFADHESVRVVDDQTGSPTSAADLARVIFDRVESGDYRNRLGTYHFTDEGSCTWWEFAREIGRLVNTECRIEACTTLQYGSKVSRPAYSVLDKSKIKAAFGIEIPLWQQSLAQCIERIKKSESK